MRSEYNHQMGREQDLRRQWRKNSIAGSYELGACEQAGTSDGEIGPAGTYGQQPGYRCVTLAHIQANRLASPLTQSARKFVQLCCDATHLSL